jgi:hypothetical protein
LRIRPRFSEAGPCAQLIEAVEVMPELPDPAGAPVALAGAAAADASAGTAAEGPALLATCILDFCHRLLAAAGAPAAAAPTGGGATPPDDAVARPLGDAWADALCRALDAPRAGGVHRAAKRVLRRMHPSRAEAYARRDGWATARHLRVLRAVVKGHDGPASELAASEDGGAPLELSHRETLEVAGTLARLGQLAALRPHNWQRHCARAPDALLLLLRAAHVLPRSARAHTRRGVDSARGSALGLGWGLGVGFGVCVGVI